MVQENISWKSQDSAITYEDNDILEEVSRKKRADDDGFPYPNTKLLRDYLNELPATENAGLVKYQNVNRHWDARMTRTEVIPRHLHIAVLVEKYRSGICVLPTMVVSWGKDEEEEARNFAERFSIDAMHPDFMFGLHNPHERYNEIGRFLDPFGRNMPTVMDNYYDEFQKKYVSRQVSRSLPRWRNIQFKNVQESGGKVKELVEEALNDRPLAKLSRETIDKSTFVMYDPVSDEVIVEKFIGDGFFVSNFGYICNVENYDLIIGRMQFKRYYILL
jgi:hypothetical protein